MDELIKLVKTYRLTTGLAERLSIADEIFRQIQPDLRFFIYGSLRPPAADDVLQETLKAIAISMGKFDGDSHREFWAWCYRIARNKLTDHYRKESSDRMQPMPEEEIRHLVEASAKSAPLSPEDRHDLEYAIQLLVAAKPECYEFLWKHFIFGFAYGEIAEELKLTYDNVRMKIGRCLEAAQSLVS